MTIGRVSIMKIVFIFGGVHRFHQSWNDTSEKIGKPVCLELILHLK